MSNLANPSETKQRFPERGVAFCLAQFFMFYLAAFTTGLLVGIRIGPAEAARFALLLTPIILALLVVMLTISPPGGRSEETS